MQSMIIMLFLSCSEWLVTHPEQSEVVPDLPLRVLQESTAAVLCSPRSKEEIFGFKTVSS